MIVGFAGRARSGKDTAATMLAEELVEAGVGVQRIAFAEPLKRFCGEVFGWGDDALHGALKDAPDGRYPREVRPRTWRHRVARWLTGESPYHDPPYLTPRYAMQTLGTEWGRDCYPRVWIEYALRRAAMFEGVTLITDVRFPNEADAVLAEGGEVWRVVRPGHDEVSAAHASEALIDQLRATRVLRNEGTLEGLRERVRRAAEARLGRLHASA